jgi:hypothetical protein
MMIFHDHSTVTGAPIGSRTYTDLVHAQHAHSAMTTVVRPAAGLLAICVQRAHPHLHRASAGAYYASPRGQLSLACATKQKRERLLKVIPPPRVVLC